MHFARKPDDRSEGGIRQFARSGHAFDQEGAWYSNFNSVLVDIDIDLTAINQVIAMCECVHQRLM